MSATYRRALNPKPLFEPTDAISAEGGAVYTLDKWQRLQRVLIIGSDRSTFYVGAQDNANNAVALIDECIAENYERVLAMATHVNLRNLSPKVDHALLVVARVARHDFGSEVANGRARYAAYTTAEKMCRTFSHLAMFLVFRGDLTGDGTKRMVNRWFNKQSIKSLAYGAIKYQERLGWSQRNALNAAHINPVDDDHRMLYEYIMFDRLSSPSFSKAGDPDGVAWKQLAAAETINLLDSQVELAGELVTASRLPREAVPNKFLGHPIVWRALAADMPYTALIRNLAKLTAVGALADVDTLRAVLGQLRSPEKIAGSRVHPIAILIAARQYAQGHGDKGHQTWMPLSSVLNALDDAFYEACKNVAPTGQRLLLAIDTSGSMSSTAIGNLSARDVAAAMAMVTARVEPQAQIVGWSDRVQEFPRHLRSARLPDVTDWMRAQEMGGTLAGLVLKHAVVMYTDSETMDEPNSFARMLATYRHRHNHGLRCVVVALTANAISLGSPNDPLTLNVAGFSADVPQIVSEFLNGDF
jgi:60 kDa SS-A/Ro ribonucleoprotein